MLSALIASRNPLIKSGHVVTRSRQQLYANVGRNPLMKSGHVVTRPKHVFPIEIRCRNPLMKSGHVVTRN